ncbi:hypothetical protein K502DRAFT_362995 [Neoconidiobolus thromboides FSU 785]|nr:hypothetical protein K502DRAFT_362995 [Neoconidiobolus thromboides FSU 785]
MTEEDLELERLKKELLGDDVKPIVNDLKKDSNISQNSKENIDSQKNNEVKSPIQLQYNIGDYLMMKQDPKVKDREEKVIIQIISMNKKDNTFTGAIFKKPDEVKIDKPIDYMNNEIIAVARAEVFSVDQAIKRCTVMQPKVRHPSSFFGQDVYIVRFYLDEKTSLLTDLTGAANTSEPVNKKRDSTATDIQLPAKKVNLEHNISIGDSKKARKEVNTSYNLQRKNKSTVNSEKAHSLASLGDQRRFTSKQYEQFIQEYRNVKVDPTSNEETIWFDSPPVLFRDTKPTLSLSYLKFRSDKAEL